MHDAELRLHELTRYADAIRRASRPCLRGIATRAKCDSYFGGMPLVPFDFQWPTKGGYRLAFIGQLHCSDVDLIPTNDGDLLFFYDNRHWGDEPSDLGHAIVLHVSGNASRVQPALPACEVATFFGLIKKTVHPKVYERVDVSLTPSTSYPSYERKVVTFFDEVDEEGYLEFCSAIQNDIQIGGYQAQCNPIRWNSIASMHLGLERPRSGYCFFSFLRLEI